MCCGGKEKRGSLAERLAFMIGEDGLDHSAGRRRFAPRPIGIQARTSIGKLVRQPMISPFQSLGASQR